jgi:signal transduction histidine kinase
LIGTSFISLVAPESRQLAIGRFRIAMTGEATSDGWLISKAGVASGQRHEPPVVVDGKVVGVYGIARTSPRAASSRARLHRRRMEAVGRLAAVVAHDFNNLLTIMQSCASMLTVELPTSSQSHADAQPILTASRAQRATQQLLAFAGRCSRLDVNRQIEAFLEMLRRAISGDIVVETELGLDTWPVFADHGQLDRVLMNLGVNARDAMPDGGTLRLRTENVVLDRKSAHEHEDLAPGAYVRIVVEDTGTGIDPDVLPNIFEPFVTTKPQGVGTGLGLSTVYGIVEQTGGAIRVASTPGRGSRFSVYLPKAEEDSLRA